MTTNKLFQGVLLLCIVSFSCNNDNTKSTVATTDTTKPSVTDNVKSNTKPPDNGGDVSFMINGVQASTLPTGENDTKHTATIYATNNMLTIYLHGYATPDVNREQLMIVAKNFNGKTGEVNNATAQYSRRDENKNEFIFGQRKEGVFKLTITKLESMADSGPLKKAMISGTFEGDMICETCFSADAKKSPLSQPQHITNGKFENVKLVYMKM